MESQKPIEVSTHQLADSDLLSQAQNSIANVSFTASSIVVQPILTLKAPVTTIVVFFVICLWF